MENKEIIDNLIMNVIDDKGSEASDDFNNLISAKVSSALETRKQELAQQIFNNQSSEDEENDQEEQEQETEQ